MKDTVQKYKQHIQHTKILYKNSHSKCKSFTKECIFKKIISWPGDFDYVPMGLMYLTFDNYNNKILGPSLECMDKHQLVRYSTLL